jgi:hypothetical protein
LWIYRTTNCNLAPIAGADNESNNSFAATVYPNPTTSEFNIAITSNVDKTIVVEVYDVLGNKVSEQQQTIVAGSSVMSSSLEGFTNGIYFVRIVDKEGNKLYNGKLIKE